MGGLGRVDTCDEEDGATLTMCWVLVLRWVVVLTRNAVYVSTTSISARCLLFFADNFSYR